MTLTRGLVVVIIMAGLLFQTACGTLLYPERRGQERGRIDPTVVILDGLLLLLFLVPGVVAFAVDFATGAIYLPPGDSFAGAQKRILHIHPDELSPETLAAAIYAETGLEVTVTEEDIRRLREAAAAR